MSGMTGKRHTEASKRAIGARHRVARVARIETDVRDLKQAGPTTIFEHAERLGVCTRTARKRLDRLMAEGRAERRRLTGMMAFTYKAT